MARKAKKKDKQGSHATPKVHPQILKRREADRIKAEKLYARGFKKLKKNRKRTSTAHSSNSSTSFSDSFQYETGGEEGELPANTSLSHSSNSEPSTSYSLGGQVKQETGGCIPGDQGQQVKQESGGSIPFGQGQQVKLKSGSMSYGQGQQVKLKSGSISYGQGQQVKLETVGNILQTKDRKVKQESAGSVPQTQVHKGKQPSASGSRVNKKTGRNCNSVREKYLSEGQIDAPKVLRNISGRKTLDGNFSVNYPTDKKLLKDPCQEQTATRNKDSVESLKDHQQPIKCVKFTSESSKKTTPKIRKDLIKKKNELQQKLEVFESDFESFDRQMNIISPLGDRMTVKKPDLAVIGDIKIHESNKSEMNKNKTYSHYDQKKRIIHIGDEHIKISLVVSEGSQVICKSIRRPIIDSDQDDVTSDSRILGKQETAKLNENFKMDSEHNDKSPVITVCTSNKVDTFESGKVPTSKGQITSRLVEDIVTNSGKDVTTTKTKCSSSSVRKISNETSEFNFEEISRIPTVYSDEDNVTPDSRNVQKQEIIIEKNIVRDAEHHDESTTDAKRNSNNFNKFSSEKFQTSETQTTAILVEDIVTESEQDEMTTENKCAANSVSEFSKETSGFVSAQENIQKVCEEFLKVFTSACNDYESRVINHLKSDQNLKK